MSFSDATSGSTSLHPGKSALMSRSKIFMLDTFHGSTLMSMGIIEFLDNIFLTLAAPLVSFMDSLIPFNLSYPNIELAS